MPTILTLTTPTGTKEVALPTFWQDVTLGQYLALLAPDAPPAEQLFTHLTAEQWAALDTGTRHEISERLLFLTNTGPLAALPPTPGLYEVGACTYAHLQQATRALAALPDAHPLAHGTQLYAIYRHPQAGQPEAERVAAAAEAHAALLVAAVTDVYADCLFFLGSYGRILAGEPATGPHLPGVAYFTDEKGRRLSQPTTTATPRRGLLARLLTR